MHFHQVHSYSDSWTLNEGPDVLDHYRTNTGITTTRGCRPFTVASYADHFSYAAERAVSRAQSLGYTIQLMDRGKLTRTSRDNKDVR